MGIKNTTYFNVFTYTVNIGIEMYKKKIKNNYNKRTVSLIRDGGDLVERI